MTYQLPKFLVVRFAPGAGANFLSSLLQCSNGVGHLDENREHKKHQQDWLGYFRDVFVSKLNQWVYHEPLSLQSFGTRNIFSASYPRGNDLTLHQFQELEQQFCSDYYWRLREQDRFITVFWHKAHVPIFFARASYINILLDPASLRWFDRAHYHKHFELTRHDQGLRVKNLEHRPSAAPTTWQGQNEFITEWPSLRAFVREKIHGNPWRARYLDPAYLPLDSQPQHTLYLSDILQFDRLWPHYRALCEFLQIEPCSARLIHDLHQHWISCHDKK